MSVAKLKQEVCKANLDLVKHGLVLFTWGNVSGIDRRKGLMVIKPSGVAYDRLTEQGMVVESISHDEAHSLYEVSISCPGEEASTIEWKSRALTTLCPPRRVTRSPRRRRRRRGWVRGRLFQRHTGRMMPGSAMGGGAPRMGPPAPPMGR